MNIKTISFAAILAISLTTTISLVNAAGHAKKAQPNLDGIELPEKYKDWKVISASHRTDNKSMRIILGNDIAVKAARSKQTNPWPDGAILGKLVWKQTAEKNWPTAIAPDEFIHAEFMFKDSKKYKANGTGWGWARWLGLEQKPYGENQSCIACHTPVKGRDWVFTTPVTLP